jgi:polysaccharide biosynthesis protein PslG
MSTVFVIGSAVRGFLSVLQQEIIAPLPFGLMLYIAIGVGEGQAQTQGVTAHVTHFEYTAEQAIFAMQEVGLQSFRDTYYWSNVENAKGVFKPNPVLRELEKAIVSARSAGQKSPLITLCCSNKLYGGGFPLSAEARGAFLRYVKWVATRLKGKVYDYQVWNEWNIGAFGTYPVKGDPAEYTRLLRDVYSALKSVDPNIRVVGGGIAGRDTEWAEALLQQGAAQYMDVISIHPYVYPQNPEISIDYLKEFSDLVNKYRSGLPIYLGEIGWTTARSKVGVSEWRQGVYLARFLLLLRQVPSVKGTWWYNLVNNGSNRAERDDNFGLRRFDMSSKHANCTMKEALAILRGSKYTAGGTYRKSGMPWFTWVTYTSNDGSYIHGIWADTDTKGATLSIGVSNGGTKEVMCERSRQAIGGTTKMWVGMAPTIIRTTTRYFSIN